MRSVADVGDDNAQWILEKRAEAFDHANEGAALFRLMNGASFAALEQAAAGCNAATRLATTQEAWAAWCMRGPCNGEKDIAAAGAAVARVVDRLEAPHLKPTGIEERLLGGLASSVFGLLTLIQWVIAPPAK